MTTQHQECCPAHTGPSDQPAIENRRLLALPLTVVGLAVAGAAVGVLDLGWNVPISPRPS